MNRLHRHDHKSILEKHSSIPLVLVNNKKKTSNYLKKHLAVGAVISNFKKYRTEDSISNICNNFIHIFLGDVAIKKASIAPVIN